MTRILQASLSRRVTLRLEATPGLPALEGDAAQVNQIIMNLILNAAEAMEPRGGHITIRTGLATLTQEDLENQYPGQALEPGAHLVLEVSDTGPGIPPSSRSGSSSPSSPPRRSARAPGWA